MSICRSLRAQQRDRVRRLGLLRSGDEDLRLSAKGVVAVTPP